MCSWINGAAGAWFHEVFLFSLSQSDKSETILPDKLQFYDQSPTKAINTSVMRHHAVINNGNTGNVRGVRGMGLSKEKSPLKSWFLLDFSFFQIFYRHYKYPHDIQPRFYFIPISHLCSEFVIHYWSCPFTRYLIHFTATSCHFSTISFRNSCFFSFCRFSSPCGRQLWAAS